MMIYTKVTNKVDQDVFINIFANYMIYILKSTIKSL